MMAGVGMVALPLLGPVNGLGVLGMAAAGLAGGSMVGALVDHGLSPDDERYVEHWLGKGRVVVVVECRNADEEGIVRDQFALQGIDNVVWVDADRKR
jgi:hypothetical protein